MMLSSEKERTNRLSPEQEKNKLLKQVKQDTDTIERLGRQIKDSVVDLSDFLFLSKKKRKSTPF